MKILKKSLAIFLTLALCLSAMLGCLSVSAAEGDPALTLVVENKTYAPGDTVRIAVDVANFADIQGAELTINLGALTDITVEAGEIQIYQDFEGNETVEVNTWITGSTVRFVETPLGVTTDTLFTIVAKAPATEGDVEVTVTNAKFGLNGTDLATNVTVTGATVKVEKACTHEKTTTSEEVTTPATCTTAGSKIVTVTCEDCKEVVSTTTEEIAATGKHNYVNGTCDMCGATEVVPCKHIWEPVAAEGSIVSPTATTTGSVKVVCTECGETSTKTLLYNQLNAIASSSAACESEILMTFGALPTRFAAKSDLTTVRVILEKEDHTADGLVKNYTLLTPEDAIVNTASSMQWQVGVRAIDMSEKITLVLICQTTDGDWYSGFVNSTSYAEYALKRVQNATVDTKIKKVLLDAVNYGAASQLATNHYTDKLANAAFDEYQELYASNTTIVPDAVNDRVLDSPSTAAVRIAGQNLLAESKTTIRFTLLKTATTNAEDVVVKVSYTDMSGNPKYFEFVNYDYAVANNMTEKLEKGHYFTVNPTNANLLYLDFAELAAAEMKIKIDLDVEVSGEYVSGVDISIENLIRIMRDNANTTSIQKACHNAMLRYGNSAYAAFVG